MTDHLSSRRELLWTAGVLGASFATAAFPVNRAHALLLGGLWGALRSFAAGVGSQVLANSVTSWLEKLGNPELEQKVNETNRELGGKGFDDDSQTLVRGDRSQFYYPLQYSNCGCRNFAAPFFSSDCGCEPITIVEGPHMNGLAFAADLLKKSEGPSFAQRVLLPKQGVQLAWGDRLSGYQNPLEYRSADATVRAHYQPRDESSGRVIVEAESSTTGRTLLGHRWDIRYA